MGLRERKDWICLTSSIPIEFSGFMTKTSGEFWFSSFGFLVIKACMMILMILYMYAACPESRRLRYCKPVGGG